MSYWGRLRFALLFAAAVELVLLLLAFASVIRVPVIGMIGSLILGPGIVPLALLEYELSDSWPNGRWIQFLFTGLLYLPLALYAGIRGARTGISVRKSIRVATLSMTVFLVLMIGICLAIFLPFRFGS